MYQRIIALDVLAPGHRQELDDAFGAYGRTFGGHAVVAGAAPAPADALPEPERVWKFSAVQLTYNSIEGDWASKDVDVLESLFLRLVAFVQTLIGTLRIKGASVTLEESLKSGEHVHSHFYLNFETAFRSKGDGGLDVFKFEGICPHIVANKAKGGGYQGAVNHGHFYTVVDKKGTLHNWTNYEPFADYKVEAWWLDNLLKHEKIDRGVYLSYASRVGIGFQRRSGDVRGAERHDKEQAMLAHVESEAAVLTRAVKPVKFFAQVEAFLQCFREDRHRRPVLAIVGGTNLGKTMLARDVLRRVAALLCVRGFLEVTVEMNENLDFSELDTRVHGGVLLDGVGDAFILKKNRESLQGQAKMCKGGQSATMMYSYQFTLARRAVVATFDLSASNLDAFQSDHWLSNSLNVMQLELNDSAFDEAAQPLAGLSVVPTRAGSKRIRI